jgi:tripartite-type tricarboxylate transporter receptor subunit TctC
LVCITGAVGTGNRCLVQRDALKFPRRQFLQLAGAVSITIAEGANMKLLRRQFLHLVAGAAALPATTRMTVAQTYPTRPIRLVLPFPPGGVFDLLGRPWADRMKTPLGTVIVENLAGAGGSLAAASVARASPDGYTILLGSSAIHLNDMILKSRPLYDPIKDLAPISMLAISASAIAVHPSVPAQNLKQFIDYARANPGKLSYGTPGAGSVNHLTGEWFKSLTAIDLTHVPYRGAGPALSDVISGQIPMVIPTTTGQVLEFHRSGKLRLLAITSPARIIAAPEIPTAVEAGVPGLISQQVIGLFAPTGTPNAIIRQIAQATRTAMADKAYQRLFIEAAVEPQFDWTAEKFRRFLDEDINRWRPIVRAIGVKLD